MLNQSFSADNFRKIFDYQNRKGINLESKFFPDVERITAKLKTNKVSLKDLRKQKSSLSPEVYEDKLNNLKRIKTELTDEKELKLTNALKVISNDINSTGLSLSLTKKNNSGKYLYVLTKSATVYFSLKQVQYNIKRLYQVKQSNRNEIISQLKVILDDTYPKIVVRADIKNFYESISHVNLFNQLNKESLLTLSSKKIIKEILRNYTELSGSHRGLPRGVGISAYLSEIYLKNLDDNIKSHPDILYYARYVDDIIAIFTPDPVVDTGSYLTLITSELDKLELSLNEEKTDSFDLTEPKNISMYYLGYDFSFGSTNLKISPSRKRISRYKKRLQITFDLYHKEKKLNEKQARLAFVKRLRFLTGNTRLRNNKRNALVGVYFSNSLANDPSKLLNLDHYLNHLKENLNNPTLLRRVSSLTFRRGYEQKHFSVYTQNDFKLIVSAWKNEN